MATFSVDDDLDKAWNRTVEQCQKITEWNLQSTGKVVNVNDVIDKIRPKSKDIHGQYADFWEEPELKAKAKDYLGKTLLCLQKFGSVIAQATSAVFGPSQQVMNGISFLIDVTQEYGKVFSGFVTIMERVSAFLGRLKVYLDEKVPDGTPLLDKRLRADVYEVLQHFLLVLTHSHKLATSKMARAKLMAGLLFFGDDQGVKDALGNLEFKIANVSRMEITVILQKVSEEARNVRRVEEKIDKMGDGVTRIEAALVVDQDRRLTKEQSEQNAQRIKDILQPDDPEAWMDAHSSFQSQVVENTGSWLLDKHAAFQRWSDPTETAPNVFILSGGEGYGKSCLSSAVIHYLLDKFPKGRTDHRVAIGYYYFRRDAKEKSSVNKALRDIIYQLTQYDSGYAKKLAPVLAESRDLTKTLDIWNLFISDLKTRVNNTFFIVIDGIDEPESEEGRPLATIVQELMSEQPVAGQLQVRIFMSGRPTEVQKIEERASVSIPEVSLGTKPGASDMPVNEADIVQFITSRLKNMDIFQTTANEEVSALQRRIPDELAAGVKGDFVRLGYKLDEISRCTRVRQIEQILERANETREDAIKRQILSLNVSLTRDEIEDLNEILNWMVGAMEAEATGWVDTECLEGVLLLKTGTPAVVSLAKQIKNKYASLLDLDKFDFVTLVSDDIRQYLVTTARETRQIQPPNEQVQVAEIAIVKRVISTFCGDDLYKRFNFEAFFESMGGEKVARIQLDEKSMHVKILQTCLVALCDKPTDDNLESLREYARMYFAEHLNRIDRQSLDNTTIKWVRTQLARLLVEPGPIDAWWDEEYFDVLQDDWMEEEAGDDEEDEEEAGSDVRSGEDDATKSESGGSDDSTNKVDDNDDNGEDDEYIDVVAGWLRDSPIEGIDSVARSWLLEVLSANKPTVLLLGRVLRRLADRWFGGTPSFDTFTCVYRLYYQIYGGQKASEDGPDLEGIETIISWARKELPSITGDAQWNFRAAVTMKCCSYFEEAILRCENCLEEQPDHWRARLCMAESLAADGQVQAACECYEKLDNLSEELREADDGIETLYWKTVLPGLADCYVSLDNPDPAVAIYERVLDHYLGEVEDGVAGDADDGQYNYTDDIEDDFVLAASAATKLMAVWYKQTNFAAMRTLLESLDRTDTGYSSTRLTGVLQRSAADSDLHEQLRALVVDASAFDFVDGIYGSAVEATSQENLLCSLALRHYQAMFSWVCGSSAEHQDRSFDIWKGIIETEIPDNADSVCFEMRISACREMPKALLHRAKELHPGSAESNSYIQRLESVADRISSVTDDRNEDPELTLARYYHLSGDEERVRLVLKKRMRDIFKDWDEGTHGYWQHLELAHTFTALDDDVNALAAWSLLAPYPPDNMFSTDDGEPVVGNDGISLAGETDEGKDSDTADEDEQTTSGADTNDESEASELDSDDNEDEDSSQEKATSTDHENEETLGHADEQTSALSGWLNSVCDGCGSSWSYVDDIYCCRDCLDVQFDSKCYPKLKAFLIDRSICHPKHDHLHLPPFDEAKWRSLVAKDAVEIRGKEVSRLEWLAKIRVDWGIERETLEREDHEKSAVAVIGQGWKAYKARKSVIEIVGAINNKAVST